MTQRWKRAITIATALGFIAALAAVFLSFRGFNPETATALEQEGETIVAALEAYRDIHGVYPPTLPDSPRLGRWYGGWKYQTRVGGQSCDLYVGEYGLHGFVLIWSSEQPSWYLDH